MNLSRGARRRMPFLLEFFSLFYPNIDAREEKRRELRAKLLEEGNVEAEKALDYLSEIGNARERAAAKLDMARVFARRGMAEQVASYVLEAAPLAGDGVSRSIARIVASTPPTPNYLSEIEEMVAAWEMHRSGEFEAFAHRLVEMGKKLTLRTFSETRLAFLQDTLESVGSSEKRIAQRLKIASVLLDLARWGAAEKQLRHALDEATGLANPKLIAIASNDLAQLLHRTNRIEEAMPLIRRALEITEATFGKRHPAVASFLNNSAILLHETSRPEEAELLMRQALEIDEAAFGKRHPAVAIDFGNLAILLQDTNRIEEAELLMRQALEIDEAAFGKRHPAVAIRLNNLATLLRQINRIEEAEPLAWKALEIDEAAFGDQHPDVARDLKNLATLLSESNRLREAEPLMRRALRIEMAAFGDQHPTVAISLNNLATLLENAGRLEEAEPLMRRSLDIFESFARQTGHEHPLFRRAEANYQALRRTPQPDEPS